MTARPLTVQEMTVVDEQITQAATVADLFGVIVTVYRMLMAHVGVTWEEQTQVRPAEWKIPRSQAASIVGKLTARAETLVGDGWVITSAWLNVGPSSYDTD